MSERLDESQLAFLERNGGIGTAKLVAAYRALRTMYEDYMRAAEQLSAARQQRVKELEEALRVFLSPVVQWDAAIAQAEHALKGHDAQPTETKT